jgi:hypothetical protein
MRLGSISGLSGMSATRLRRKAISTFSPMRTSALADGGRLRRAFNGGEPYTQTITRNVLNRFLH